MRQGGGEWGGGGGSASSSADPDSSVHDLYTLGSTG